MLAVGLFADGTYGFGWNGVAGPVKGLFYGDGGQLVAQVFEVVVGFIWAWGVTYLIFIVLRRFVQLRVSPEIEIEGTDAGRVRPGVLPGLRPRDRERPGFARGGRGVPREAHEGEWERRIRADARADGPGGG